MNNDNKLLELYLRRLDNGLSRISVSEKAEIIMEIRGHILDALEKSEDKDLAKILDSFGSPEQMANKYLGERNIPPLATKDHTPLFKWIVIGVLGMSTLCIIGLSIVLWKFTPLIKVDESNDRVTLLGGIVTIEGDGEGVEVKANFKDKFKNLKIHEDISLDKLNVQEALFKFNNGKIEIENSRQNVISWKCRLLDAGQDQAQKEVTDSKVFVDLTGIDLTKCKIFVPADILLVVKGNNGKLELDELKNNIEASIHNGKISFGPEGGVDYRYDLNVANGSIDNGFNSSDKANAYQVKLSLTNGKIVKD